MQFQELLNDDMRLRIIIRENNLTIFNMTSFMISRDKNSLFMNADYYWYKKAYVF